MKNGLRSLVLTLEGVTCSTGGKYSHPEFAAYERALDRTGRLLIDMSRLGLEERLVRLTKAQGEQVIGVITGALDELGLSLDEEPIRLAVVNQIRPLASGDG